MDRQRTYFVVLRGYTVYTIILFPNALLPEGCKWGKGLKWYHPRVQIVLILRVSLPFGRLRTLTFINVLKKNFILVGPLIGGRGGLDWYLTRGMYFNYLLFKKKLVSTLPTTFLPAGVPRPILILGWHLFFL